MGAFNFLLPLVIGVVLGFILRWIWDKRKGVADKNVKYPGGGMYQPPNEGIQGTQKLRG